MKKQLGLYFGAVLCISVAVGVNESIFNNFLSDTFSLTADARGWLEFPRELPGLLVVLMTGLLCMLPVTRVGVIGGVVFALGMLGLGLFGSSYSPMLLMMLISSAGMHLIQPVASSIALGLSDTDNRGRRLGQAGAIGTLGMVVGAGLVWFLFDESIKPYRAAFAGASLLAGLGAIVYSLMHIPHLHQPRAGLVIRKRFSLYYTLEFLFGARKQIFLTFGPWVLIKVYHLPATSIAGLLMIAAIIGVAFKPLAGIAIDHFGERNVMVFDGIILAVVCLGYGYALRLPIAPHSAQQLACACFILDNLLFALGTGRSVYLSRMTENHQELSSSLAMGVSINHIASMVIPGIAGILWMKFGYERVFLTAALFAIFISYVATRVPGKGYFASPLPTLTPAIEEEGNTP